MGKFFVREKARDDLVAHVVYLAEKAPSDVADRFLESAEATFTELASQPFIGAPLGLQNPEFAGIRKWRVRGFENHLVFYEARPDGVSVVRVLHAASDWWALLGFEE